MVKGILSRRNVNTIPVIYIAKVKYQMTFNHSQMNLARPDYIRQHMVGLGDRNNMKYNISSISSDKKCGNSEPYSLNYIRNKMIFG